MGARGVSSEHVENMGNAEKMENMEMGQSIPNLAPRGPPRAPKGAFWAKTGPFRTPGGPEGARYQVKVCGEHESNPGGPIRGIWDQIWSPGVPKGAF